MKLTTTEGLRGLTRGDYDGAIADYTRALELKPDYAEALNNRGYAWVKKGNLGQALKDFSRAIEINPLFPDAYTSKAWILATSAQDEFRDGIEAVRLATIAVDIAANADSLNTLAAAFAETGQFDNAKSTQKRAIQLLIQQKKTADLEPYIQHLNVYNAGKPLRIDYKPSGLRSNAARFIPPRKTKADRNQTESASGLKPVMDIGSYPYTIQVSAFRDAANSVSEVAALKKKGDRAFACPVRIPGKGVWNRVFIGHYRSRAEAQTAAAALRKRKFRYARVTHKPYTVQVGLVDSQQGADEIMVRLEARGYVTYSLPDPDGSGNIRILIGAYGDRNETEKLTEQLTADGFDHRIMPR